MKLTKLNPHQSGNVAAFVTRLQTDKTHQITYFGNDAAEIAAAIQTFDPPQASLRLEREGLPTLSVAPDVVELTSLHHQAFIALHDALFPNTYFSGSQIINRLGSRDKVFIAFAPRSPDFLIPIAYIYAKIDPEATDGYIDYLGVYEPFRRKGIATGLISTAINWLFSFSEIEAVTLTVEAANIEALALYSSIGFTHLYTLQFYRKRY